MTITAKIIADSVSAAGVRLTTMQLRYPKFIHGEFMTHRVFSRNASSSRAIPVERLIKDVLDDPAMPLHWGKNQPGMQAREECNTPVELPGYGLPLIKVGPRTAWLEARDEAVIYARNFTDAGYHKQIVNRLLEPFCHINVVVTATEWDNFFWLRCHPDAQPEMQALADAMRAAMNASTPDVFNDTRWHLPYVTADDILAQDDFEPYDALDRLIQISVARCARVSYLTHEGKKPSIEEDLALYEKLVRAVPMHASPMEHQATPDRYVSGAWRSAHLHANFRGWRQYRQVKLWDWNYKTDLIV